MSLDWSAEVGKRSRLRLLERSELLDSPVDEAFDRLTVLSARLLRAPVALLARADSNLYGAKRDGRNRVHAA